MYHFVSESLGPFTSPAVILEADSLRYIERNAAADAWFQRLGEAPDEKTARSVMGALGVTPAMLDAVSHLGPDTLSHPLPGRDGGVLHVTRLDSLDDGRRPALLLLSLHTGEPHAAWEIHNRLVMAVQVNEAAEITLRSLEASIRQLGEVVEAQRALVSGYNARMAAFMAASDAGEFPTLSQTYLDPDA